MPRRKRTTARNSPRPHTGCPPSTRSSCWATRCVASGFSSNTKAGRRDCGAWGVHSTIVVFGSARVREDGREPQAHWYREARTFGRIVSERGGALHANGAMRDNVIATGGGPGSWRLRTAAPATPERPQSASHQAAARATAEPVFHAGSGGPWIPRKNGEQSASPPRHPGCEAGQGSAVSLAVKRCRMT
jgi:hypothetical protein